MTPTHYLYITYGVFAVLSVGVAGFGIAVIASIKRCQSRSDDDQGELE